jgi:hypothetical protein
MIKYTNEKLEKDLILAAENYTDLAKKYLISRPTVRAYAKRLNLHKGNVCRLKTYTLNENYFKVIDTKNKAYILGFIYADGCNTRRGLKIGLVETDKEILEFIKKEIDSNNELKYIKPFKKTWSFKWELSISSMQLSKDLTNMGCPPNKSLILKFPNFISNEFMSHFIRGYFDGDGGINNKNGSWHITFTSGSKEFIEELKKHLDNLNIFSKIYIAGTKKTCFTISLARKKEIQKLINYMYKDADFSLARKKEKALLAIPKN